MSITTAADLREWKRRWALVAEREIEELRATSMDVKLRQIAELFEAGEALGWKERSPEEQRQVAQVQDVWLRLKKASHV